MAFSPTEYCRLFAQKKAYQEGGGGHGHRMTPPPATPLTTEIPLPCGTIHVYQVVNFVLAGLGINAKVESVFEYKKTGKGEDDQSQSLKFYKTNYKFVSRKTVDREQALIGELK